ncbi:type II toxin-antitoxin system RelE/ParE family toxin [Polaribacter sp. 11A2H]|uniref:type II toxin-antitoxin system RelE/ParE family toxin n=1 Tax=Polaribacter sp. 11A2H TaxID=2687290 RepID=UPI00140D4964|nr:type II toxin-antitoxin system RelE/ParE family toxin [Polaribacter sp. 11A2H]
MEIIWSDFAKKMLKEIHYYHKKKANKIIADNIKKDIFSTTKQLDNFPNSGTEENALKILNQNHKYLISGNYKIIYRPIKEGMLITDVFDTRQNPKKINNPNR